MASHLSAGERLVHVRVIRSPRLRHDGSGRGLCDGVTTFIYLFNRTAILSADTNYR